MIRMIKKLITVPILLLLSLNSSLFSQEGEQDILKTYDVYEPGSIFTITGDCVPTCRVLQKGFSSKVVDFNPFNGITKCVITRSGNVESNEFNITADTENTQCIKEIEEAKKDITLESDKLTYPNLNKDDLSYYNDMSFSRKMAGLVTLDSDIIDIEATIDQNMLQDNSKAIELSGNVAFDSLNKANLGFFVNLLFGWQNIYTYTLYFLFIFIGAFFLSLVVWNLSVDKIGKTGQKTRLNNFILPLAMTVLCFVPIPNKDKINTTMIQHIIQYFTQTSNKLADRLVVPAANAYVKKIYSMAGYTNYAMEKATKERLESIKVAKDFYIAAHEMCTDRYDSYYKQYKNFQTRDRGKIQMAESSHPEDFQDFTFFGCKKLEADLINLEREKKEKEYLVESLEKGMSGETITRLNEVRGELEKKVNTYGWWYAAYMPTLSVVVENLSLIKDPQTLHSQNFKEKNISLENEYEVEKSNDYLSASEDGSFVGGLAYFILPGAHKVYDLVKNKIEESGSNLNSLAGDTPTVLINIISQVMDWATKTSAQNALNAPDTALLTVQILYSSLLKYLPLVVGMVAGFIVIASYLLDLFRYFFISPFIVLYSITKGRQNKILEFFVDGIGIFLKPLLITISIFLSIFIYYLFMEIFGGLTSVQFSILQHINRDSFGVLNSVTLSSFHTLATIILSIATAYIMFRIVIEGAKTFLSLAGLQDKEGLSNTLAQRMDRHAFQV